MWRVRAYAREPRAAAGSVTLRWMSTETMTLAAARRVALAAQGFDRPRPQRVDKRQVLRAVRQLGLLQLDYVNVLGPAHYHVLFSRLGPYRRGCLDDLVYDEYALTEQWGREASIIPVETWPLLRHRMEEAGLRTGGIKKLLRSHPEYFDEVLEEVRRRGPICADDLDAPEGVESKLDGWVGTVQRGVLETHFARGLLASAERLPNFVRVYDLAERVIPSQIHARKVDRAEAERQLTLQAAVAHGVATAPDLADYWRLSVRTVRERIAELVEAGRLVPVQVEGWKELAHRPRKILRPRRIDAAALLSPFDPIVCCRNRARRLFDFDYRVEIFIPKSQRKWGYYVLPFLLGDRIVARVDLKADRRGGRLQVLSAYLEPHAEPEATAHALAEELGTLSRWHGYDVVTVGRKGGFARTLAAACRETAAG
jgi:uncharacterized protein YcaQ